MKIGMLSRWNTACGVSLHAELVGREWVKMGHKLIVFAPNNIRPVSDDEEYVYRCFSDEGNGATRTFLDPTPFLTEDYEIFVAQRIEWAPLKLLREIFPEIRRRTRTVYVVHERRPPSNPLFYEFEWDVVVCFDERYERQWLRIFPGKIRIIPYPVPNIRREDKLEARRKLNLSPDEKIVFSYGWAPELHVAPILPCLTELSRNYSFTYLVLMDPTSTFRLMPHSFVRLKYERPSLERLYVYLHAADVCLIHKQASEVRQGEVVLSSSVLMCLGALTPILTSDTEFVSFLDKEVIKYQSLQQLEKILAEILEGKYDFKETLEAAEKYAKKNSQTVIAKKFIELFEEL
ncbi:MAG: hypothetical protein J7K49_02230 [Thaumarchaeota archaeon]|nr:hypothetical protein [Nitrososphaerota archaeon]